MRLLFPERLVTPHLTVRPDGYDPKRIPSVLYVGQATGPNDAEDGSPSAKEIRQKLRNFLKRKPSDPETGFWRFALLLSNALKNHTGHPEIAPLQNLVWTNICKIGVCKFNPSGAIYEGQRELAVQTLQAEIKVYKPTLIYWATNNYATDVVGKVVDDPNNISWTKDLQNKGIRTRKPLNALPAMFWGPHPGRKPRTDWDLWVKLACNLIGT
jgi:hypothetical protein